MQSSTAKRRRLLIAGAAGGITLGLGVLLMPHAPRLSSETIGDPELIAHLADSGPGHHMSVAIIDGGEVRTAHFGADDATEYEIGSVTKTVTASLLVEAIERDEVEPDTQLGDLLDVGDGPVSNITLEQLATQSSGLPGLPTTPQSIAVGYWAQLRAGNPYPYDVPALLDHARATDPTEPGTYLYSNLGFALLGQALASAAGTDYADLVEQRITGPLGMDATSTPSELPAGAPHGLTAGNRAAAPWTADGYAPAGAMRSTLDDMVIYLQAQLDGTAPGVDATTPRSDAGELGEIGYAWTITDGVTWHNGMTGGYGTWVGFDRDTDRAVVILTDTAIWRDALGFELMGAP